MSKGYDDVMDLGCFSSCQGLGPSSRGDPYGRSRDCPGVRSACDWLTSSQLESHVTHAMAELQDVLRGSLEVYSREGYDNRGILITLCNMHDLYISRYS